MADYTFDLYFLKLSELETRNLKCRKIEPQPFVCTTVLPDSVLDVLCDVYRKVVFVTRVMPYMYQQDCIEFRSDFVDHLLGSVRIVPPDELLVSVSPVVCMEVDLFYLHLSNALKPLAVQQDFRVTKVDMFTCTKTTSGGKMLTLLNRMSYLTERWAQNMQAVLTLMQAQVAFDNVVPYSEAYDAAEGVVMPREGFEDELAAAVHVAVTDKPVLQHGMQMLRAEFLATKCSFAKPTVSWIKKAWKGKMNKYKDLPVWEQK